MAHHCQDTAAKTLLRPIHGLQVLTCVRVEDQDGLAALHKPVAGKICPYPDRRASQAAVGVVDMAWLQLWV